MQRIIIHHTAGSYKPNEIDFESYHILIDNFGNVYKGKYKIKDNEDCRDLIYARHTYLGNTGSIGIAACCNYGFDLKHKQSLYPFTLKQFNKLCLECAKLCKEYNIQVNHVYTHYGFDKIHNIKQGKIDITYLPWKPELNPDQVENYFRQEIRKYLQKLT